MGKLLRHLVPTLALGLMAWWVVCEVLGMHDPRHPHHRWAWPGRVALEAGLISRWGFFTGLTFLPQEAQDIEVFGEDGWGHLAPVRARRHWREYLALRKLALVFPLDPAVIEPYLTRWAEVLCREHPELASVWLTVNDQPAAGSACR